MKKWPSYGSRKRESSWKREAEENAKREQEEAERRKAQEEQRQIEEERRLLEEEKKRLEEENRLQEEVEKRLQEEAERARLAELERLQREEDARQRMEAEARQRQLDAGKRNPYRNEAGQQKRATATRVDVTHKVVLGGPRSTHTPLASISDEQTTKPTESDVSSDVRALVKDKDVFDVITNLPALILAAPVLAGARLWSKWIGSDVKAAESPVNAVLATQTEEKETFVIEGGEWDWLRYGDTIALVGISSLNPDTILLMDIYARDNYLLSLFWLYFVLFLTWTYYGCFMPEHT